jgi:hypothetical protein
LLGLRTGRGAFGFLRDALCVFASRVSITCMNALLLRVKRVARVPAAFK